VRIRLLLPVLFSLFTARAALAQAAPAFDHVNGTVVVFNSDSPESKEIAEYYIKARGIAPGNQVGLRCPLTETITREVYTTQIEGPLRAAFSSRGWWRTQKVANEGNLAVLTSVRVLVIIKGIPLRISEQSHGKDPKTGQPIAPQPLEINAASVDSEFACFGILDRKIDGPIKNLYFTNPEPFWKTPLTPLFLTGRIDGPDKATAIRLIDDAIAVEKAGGLYGKAYIDLAQKNDGGYKQGEDWIRNCAALCIAKGIPVAVDHAAPTFPKGYPMKDAALYFGWYTEHVDGPFLSPSFRFARGAVACHIHSFSASTLTNPNSYWSAPLLARGAAFTPGNVWEPYLSMCTFLDVMTDRLLAGWMVSEAAWCATPAMSWMNTMLGDPLYRPFPVTTSGDRKKSADYRALRLAAQRWSAAGDRDALIKNLQEAGSSLKSGSIYEFLAERAQTGKPGAAAREAAPWLKLAETAYKDPADQLRIALTRAGTLRRDGDPKAAARVLEEAATKFARIPESEAARIYLKQLREQP